MGFSAPMPQGLLILGFGGHARVVADIAMALGIKEFCFVDQAAREGEQFLGHPVVAGHGPTLPPSWKAFAASGDAARREAQCAQIAAAGWPLATLIAPSATIGAGAQIGAGTLVAQHAHLGPMARIGEGCIINTGAIVEHESTVGAYSHISVHATVAGRSSVGRAVMIGAGATVIDGVVVGDHITVGAGGVVVRSLQEAGVYVGVPVRRVGGAGG